MAGSALIGRSIVVRNIVVEKDGHVASSSGFGSAATLPGNKWSFKADHWHEIEPKSEYSSPALDIIDSAGETIASFLPHSWDRVYYND